MSDGLSVFKALADETRLKILMQLKEKDMYVELLAQRLQLTPATVSFHLKKLLAAGLVEQKRDQYYMMYSIKIDVLTLTIGQLAFPEENTQTKEALLESQYRQKVIKSFMPYGVCKTLPAQVKKRMIVYEEIFNHFETGKTYKEKEVNEIIGKIHEDFCTVRRAFIGLGWMTRENGIYTVVGIGNRNEMP
ncbi:MAG: metalloregulator ArsR/SmtB family transcription factor [Clostridia bacterium]|nr:metalloregulator ArsR/SmtB family transcription factor [Clostridia bacterium]